MQQGHVTKNKRGQRYNLSKKYLEKLLKQAEKGVVDVIKKAPMSKSKNSTKKASKAQKKGTKAKQTKKAGTKANKKPVVVQRSLMTRSRRVTILK